MNTDSLLRATDRWQSFVETLTASDITVLDRGAAGHKLKVVCHEQDVSYDATHKRFKRWQQTLNLPSLVALLYVWRATREQSAQPDLDEPTLMRHASGLAKEMSRRLSRPAQRLEVSAERRRRHPQHHLVIDSRARRESHRLALAQSVLSPALWHALLGVGQDMGHLGMRRVHIPAQHCLFVNTVAGSVLLPKQSRAVLALLDWARDIDTTGFMARIGRAAPFALPMILTARHAGVLEHVPISGAEIALSHCTIPQASFAWQQLAGDCASAAYDSMQDIEFLQALWRRDSRASELRAMVNALPPALVLGPCAGLALSVLAADATMPLTALAAAEKLRSAVDARLRHAEILGIHPLRLLAHFSMQDAGVEGDLNLVLLATGELLLDEEGFIPGNNALPQISVRA